MTGVEKTLNVTGVLRGCDVYRSFGIRSRSVARSAFESFQEELSLALGDDRVSGFKDRTRRAVILLQVDRLNAFEICGVHSTWIQRFVVRLALSHLVQILDLRCSPSVDRLIRISDNADSTMSIGKAPHQLVLCRIGVLCANQLRVAGNKGESQYQVLTWNSSTRMCLQDSSTFGTSRKSRKPNTSKSSKSSELDSLKAVSYSPYSCENANVSTRGERRRLR